MLLLQSKHVDVFEACYVIDEPRCDSGVDPELELII
jgi:hypothetical protein